MKIVESNDLGKRIERATWIELFLKEVEATQMRLNEL